MTVLNLGRAIFLMWLFENVAANNKVEFLKNYFEKMGKTSVVETHLCWRQAHLSTLTKTLTMGNKYVHSHGKLNDKLANFHRIFLTDESCPFFNSLIENALTNKLMQYPSQWVIFGNLSSLMNKGLYCPITSHITIVDNNYTLKSMYKINNNSSDYLINDIGQWSISGFNYYNQLSPIQNRTNFQKWPLRVSYVFTNNKSYENIHDDRDKHIDKPTKINYLLLEHIVDLWNLSHKPIVQDSWGFAFDPVKLFYKGMFGDLVHGRADVGGTACFTAPDRFKYLDFLVASIKDLNVFFVFMAPPLPYSSNLFALPFDTNVWICSAVVSILFCLIIWIIMTWEGTVEEFEEERELYKDNSPSLLDVILMQLGITCQMDYYYEPRSASGRMATLFSLLGFMFIYTAFCARIVILLQSSADNLHDVRDLHAAKFDMGAEDTPYNILYLTTPSRRTNEEWRKLVLEKLTPKGKPPKFLSASKGMKLVQNSYFAFQVELTTAADFIEYTFTNDEKCFLRVVDAVYKSDIAHLPAAKNSIYKEYVLMGFHRLYETGVHSREHRKKISKIPKCSGENTNFVSVGWIESRFAFEVYAVGVVLSLLIFAGEVIVDKHSKIRY